MKILIATKNSGKFQEIKELLQTLPVESLSLLDLEIAEEFLEKGESFEENALAKAVFYFEKSGLPTLADDSGILVEALAQELGVKTRRWGAGETASDIEWLDYFMERMRNEKNRKAKFVCAAAYAGPRGQQVFLGETKGAITETVEAPLRSGIPLSSVFKPAGHKSVYAALPPEEKNRLSHRGKAFKKLVHFFWESFRC